MLEMTHARPPITEADLKRYEVATGRQLHPEYKRFLLETNGGKPVRNEYWNGDSGYCVHVFYSLDPESLTFDSFGAEWIPEDLWQIAYDPFGNAFCIDASSAVYFVDHETGEVIRIAESLGRFLEGLKEPPETPLEAAIRAGTIEEVRSMLLSDKANVWSAVPLVMRHKRKEVRLLLYELGACTPRTLQAAAIAGDIEMVEELVRAGIPIDGKNEVGRTPLMQAVDMGTGDMVRTLLRLGADPRIKDPFGADLLRMATIRPVSDPEIIEIVRRALGR